MDDGEKEQIEAEMMNEGSVSSYHTPSFPSDWPCGGVQGDLITPVSPLSSIADSYVASMWENHPSNSQPLEFNGINAHTSVEWQEPNSLLKGGLLLPIVSSASIAGFMDSFSMNQSASPYNQLITPMSYGPHAVFMDTDIHGVSGREPQKNVINPYSASMDGSLSSDHRKQEGSPQIKNTRYIDEAKLANSDESDSGGDGCQEEPSLMDTGTESSPSKGCHLKKRKRGGKDAENEQSQQLSGGDGDATNNSKHSSPLKPKEDYIHVRARRGQATNSHSLAERVRREKIRERMKLLQDLVPSCSKVTGKAVMLDEIINYVQSLQRQVEFLSMKLATLDPKMDFNIDCVLAKEQMFTTRAHPSSLGLSPNMRMAYPFTNLSQPSISVIGSSSDALGNLDSQLTSLNEGYKEPTPQMPNVWDDELQNVVQMGFSPSAPLDNQETPRNTGHMKAELGV